MFKDGFGVAVGALGISGLHGHAAVALVVHFFHAHNFMPGAVCGRVQVNPGDNAVPRLRVQYEVLVSRAQVLHEFRRACVEFQRREQMQIALHGMTAYVLAQGEIRGREVRPGIIGGVVRVRMDIGQVAEIGLAGICAVVAPGAIPVKHGLHLPAEGETPYRTVPGGNARRRAARRFGGIYGRRGVLGFMAADTGDGFTRHGGHPAAHQLQGLAPLVEGLYGYGGVCRHAETGGTVFLDGHGAQHALDIPGSVQSDPVNLPAHAVIRILIGVQAELFHRAAGYAFEPVADVDVADEDIGVPALQVNSRRNDRRPWNRSQRNRLKEGIARLFAQQDHVVKNIHKINTPERVRMRFAGHEKIRFTQREGVQKFRPGFIHQVVFQNRGHGSAVTGDALHHAVGFLAAEGGIEYDEFAHARYAVMTAHYRYHFRGMAGDGAGVKHGIRPVGIAAVIFHLAGAVRVHVKQDA